MSGDCTITDTGVITCASSGSTEFTTVSTITDLQAVDTSKYFGAYVRDAKTGGLFHFDSSDLSTTLVLFTITSTGVNSGTGVITAANHGLVTGDTIIPAASVDGLNNNTYYYVINIDANNFKLASSFSNALAGTAITLTGTTNFTSQKMRDPMQMVYIIAGSTSKTGTTGAWIRQAASSNNYSPYWGNAACDAATDDYQVFFSMVNLVDNGAVWDFPIGLCGIGHTINISKPISLTGVSKLSSGLYGLSLGTDTSLINYAGTTGSRIQNIRIQNLAFWSDNNEARGLTLTWVNKYAVDNVYFYQLYRGAYLDTAFNGSWSNISQYNSTSDTFYLATEDNNIHFDRVEVGGVNGIQVVGNMADLEFTAIDAEGITSSTGCGINLAPTTGNVISGVRIHGYGESILGSFLCVAGVDADSVRGLNVSHAYITGSGIYAIILTNAVGFDFNSNVFSGWTNAFFNDNTGTTGIVANNTLTTAMALSSTSDTFGSNVQVANNFNISTAQYVGRRVQWLSSVPTVGHYTIGDMVWNTAPSIDANSLILLGWPRLTTGTGNTVGTDWGRAYVKQNSP
jgi:hypothetical protein